MVVRKVGLLVSKVEVLMWNAARENSATASNVVDLVVVLVEEEDW